MPFSRFHGLTGVVIGERGAAYEVSVKDGNKTKMVVARPEHLVRNKDQDPQPSEEEGQGTRTLPYNQRSPDL
jgi:hypothetical protein